MYVLGYPDKELMCNRTITKTCTYFAEVEHAVSFIVLLQPVNHSIVVVKTYKDHADSSQ